ncbi:MAG TPA: sulfite exporter TauE/SafE family protein [Vicinamibacterales bacterium]|nr:sulfite exporter TauE/SafE family protein [Vicinamibacterales bacterium]
MISPAHLAAFAAALVAGAINSVAGGGTLITFPVLIWIGLPSVTANATSTVAIWPGSLGSIGGYRRELKGLTSSSYVLIVPSAAGGIIGAVLLRMTPAHVFDRLVPLLILFATFLFMLQEPVTRLIRRGATDGNAGGRGWVMGAIVFQFFVALYGGYFGAGIGILMLAALGILGYTDIHQMNGLKNLLALAINGVAALYFISMAMVRWPEAIIMAVGAIAGGYGGAGLARKIGAQGVRRIVIIIGFGMTLSLLLRR